MTITVDLEGLSDLERLLSLDRLTTNVARSVHDAAALGVEAEQNQHPYTDRTYNLTSTAKVDPVSSDPFEPEVDMYWPAEYAGFVDERAQFAFTPTAIEAAETAIEYGIESVVDDFIDG